MRLPTIVSLVFLAACSAASAGPDLLLGVDDDDLKWTEGTKDVVAAHQAAGFKAVRITLLWRPGLAKLDDDGRTYIRRAQTAAKLGHRVVVGVYGDPASPPLSPELRTQLCGYVVDALSRARNVDDVVIWNEANSALFWRPQKGAAAAYAALLAECYDTLHKYRRTVNVISSTSPHEDPGSFLRDVGVAYRASGRTLPIFDTFGHNVYPETTRESPLTTHAGLPSLDQGDYVRLLDVLTAAFGGTAQPAPGAGSIATPGSGSGSKAVPGFDRPVTLWYLEDGFETVVAADKRARYTGREPNRFLVQPVATRARTSARAVPDQVSQLRDAIELAYCQPAVGAFFNFQFADEVGLGGWQSGLLWADGTPKPSYEPVKALLAGIAAASVDCGRFPVSVTGPRTPPAVATP
ncbi:MAG: hypothetical protein QOJ22_714 [Thermoleophilaceae bacterium]|nr:hypothetical protein [Thermoleophilaceae bacterium]